MFRGCPWLVVFVFCFFFPSPKVRPNVQPAYIDHGDNWGWLGYKVLILRKKRFFWGVSLVVSKGP